MDLTLCRELDPGSKCPGMLGSVVVIVLLLLLSGGERDKKVETAHVSCCYNYILRHFNKNTNVTNSDFTDVSAVKKQIHPTSCAGNEGQI